MSIAEAETATRTPSHWEVLMRAWKQPDLPEGRRAEVIEGATTTPESPCACWWTAGTRRPGGGATLYSDPEDGRYNSSTKVPFGKEIHLPEPFDLTIDTSALAG